MENKNYFHLILKTLIITILVVIILSILLSVFGKPTTADEFYSRAGKQTDIDKAILDYSEAIRLDPNFTFAYWYRAELFSQKDELDMAIKDYTEVIRLDPVQRTSALTGRGILYSETGEIDLAIKDYTEAIRLDKDSTYPVAYSYRGDLYYKIGELDLAIADFNEIIRRNPDSKFYREKLDEAIEKRDGSEIDRGIARLTEEIQRNPNNADLYFRRGYAYAYNQINPSFSPMQEAIVSIFSSATDRWDKAIADWEMALRINPNHINAKKYLEQARGF